MERIISQETFNAAVKENADLLGISAEEAVQETIQQFKAQGVNLSNISKEISVDDENFIVSVIEKLADFNEKKNYAEQVQHSLNSLKEFCEKGIEYRILAGKLGAYQQLINILSNSQSNEEMKVSCLTAMVSLITKQPDLLDDKGVQIIFNYIDQRSSSEIIILCLKWAKECCVYHEMNRQNIVKSNILNRLSILLDEANNVLLTYILSLLRVLILDDDVRVEFGKAHDHAKMIATGMLPPLINLLDKFKTDANVVGDLILTISNLLVRHEFCKQVTEVGGLELIREIMTEYSENEKINRQCFKLLKALAGDDNSKVQVMKKDMAPLIVSALNNSKSATTVSAGLGCVAALCLRCPENSKIIFESGIVEVIVEKLRSFPEDRSVQKTGSWAIRNMVSRSKDQCIHFIELGVEELLKDSLRRFKDCEYDIKAALRDLGCEVQLKEEWTGKGGLLNHP